MNQKISRMISALSMGILFTAQMGVMPVSAENALPSSFDLREKGLVSSVKEQALEKGSTTLEPLQNCWAFSAMNAMETNQIQSNPLIDLSEWHLAYYMYCGNFGYPSQTENIFDAGSQDVSQEWGMLTSWVGAVDEKDAPYGNSEITNSTLNMKEVQNQSKYHVTDVSYYPSTDRDAIKSEIYSGHALGARYTHTNDCYNEKYHSYYLDWDIAKNQESSLHSISIVGWDDNFSAENFNTKPSQNGAWLVKNSWGTDWGEYGYFWISYDEKLSDVYSVESEKTQAYTNLFQHDDYGYSGILTISNQIDSIYSANIFTTDTSQWVTSVMVCGDEVDYEVSVYTGITDPKDPLSGTLSASANGTFGNMGYHTIKLDTPILVEAGTTFSIVAKTKGNDIFCEQASHTEWNNADGSTSVSDSIFNMELLERNFKENQSFFSANGTEWIDMYSVPAETHTYTLDGTESTTTMKYGNISLKAVTQDAGVVSFSETADFIKSGTPIALTTFEDADIYYSLNGGDYVKYESPIIFNGDMTITAYADTPDGINTSATMRFQEAEPMISSFLCVEDGHSGYASMEEKNVLHYTTQKGTRKISVMPILDGAVSCNGERLPSGKLTDISLSGGVETLELEVKKDDTIVTYQLTIEESEPTEKDPFQIGDVDKSGSVDAGDASLILIYAAQLGAGKDTSYADEAWRNRADFNRVNNVNASDAAAVLRYAAKRGAGA